MNTITLPLARAAALAAALFALSVSGYAGESSNQSADHALKIMRQTGSVSLESVADVRIGSTQKAAAESLGYVNCYLSDGSWLIYKDFYVDHSSAHGTLVVSLKDGRVSAMKLVSPAVAVTLAAHRGYAPGSLIVIASNR